MSGMHLKQSGFTYTAYGPFNKNKERIQKFMKTGNKNYFYKNDLDKACPKHHMVYGKYRDLNERTELGKVLRKKALKIASNPKYDGYKRGLVSMVYKFFDKTSASLADKSAKGGGIKYMSNEQMQMNIVNKLLENFKKEKFILHLETVLGVLI